MVRWPLVAAAFLVGACAAPQSWMGIGLLPGAAAPDIQQLAERARTGDKQAALDLGIRFEDGRGVALDLPRARRLYAMAATTTGGTIYVYVPPVKKGGRGSTTPVNTGPVSPGIAEAKRRLKALDAMTSKPSRAQP